MGQSIDINGKSLQQIADETGISYNTLYVRWKRNGKKLDDIVPKKTHNKKSEPIMTPEIIQMAKDRNLGYSLVYKRLENGWDLERALNTPVNKNENIKQIAKENNINHKVILTKIKKGLTLDEAVTEILKNKNKKNLKSMDLKQIYELNKTKKETKNDKTENADTD